MSETVQWHCKTTYKSDSRHWFYNNHSLLHDIMYNTWSLARAFVTAHTLENAPIQRWSRIASAILSHEATCSKRHCARPYTAGTHHSTAEVSTQVFTLFSSYGDNNLFKGKNKLYLDVIIIKKIKKNKTKSFPCYMRWYFLLLIWFFPPFVISLW